MEKQLNYIKLGLVGLSLLMVLLFVMEALSITVLIKYSIGLLGLVVVATLGGALLNLVENPSKGKNFVIGIVGLIIIYAISYGVAEDSVDSTTELVIEGSRIAEAGIYTLYVVVEIAVAALLYSSVKRIFK